MEQTVLYQSVKGLQLVHARSYLPLAAVLVRARYQQEIGSTSGSARVMVPDGRRHDACTWHDRASELLGDASAAVQASLEMANGLPG